MFDQVHELLLARLNTAGQIDWSSQQLTTWYAQPPSMPGGMIVVVSCVVVPWVIDDQLWELIEPMLPVWPARSPGPRPVPDRLCLQGILLVLYTGIGWEDLPQELGFGSGMTCWRRLARWTEAGVFDKVHQLLLARLNAAGQIDWSRAVMDAAHVDAKKGAKRPGRRRSTAANPAASTT